MRLIDKCNLTEIECERIECKDNFIIVTLGPYRNYRTRNKDFYRMVNNWRNQNNMEELPKSSVSVKSLCKWVLSLFMSNIISFKEKRYFKEKQK